MACGATLSLKRSLEFDPLHTPGHRTPKRRRCMPMTMSPSPPPAKSSHVGPSPFTSAVPKLTREEIAAKISDEIRLMRRRKQLMEYAMSKGGDSSGDEHSVALTDMPSGSDLPNTSSVHHPTFRSFSQNRRDVPLFTFRQMTVLCEKMVKEREERLREEYDQVLNCKLSEQYEAFLKFNHDQLHRRFTESAASYVS